LLFSLPGWNSFSCRPAAKAGLRDIDQQVRHLGLAGQLPQHGAEAALHFGELRLVGVEVGGALLLALELRAQVQLVRLGLLQHRPVVVPHEHVPGECRAQKAKISAMKKPRTGSGQRPTSRGSRRTELIEKFISPQPS
jgi:hypothetical protein